jgi:hypothetical protein
MKNVIDTCLRLISAYKATIDQPDAVFDIGKVRGEIFGLIKRIDSIKQSPIKSLTTQSAAARHIDTISIQDEKSKGSKSTPTVTV